MIDKGRSAKGKQGKSKPDPQSDTAYDTGQIAVALQYDHKTSKAPKVVATGRGAIADQILQLAFANGVKVRQDADLAEILSAVDVDTEIPLEAFAAVAEILAYVYRANGAELPSEEDAAQTDGEPEQDTSEIKSSETSQDDENNATDNAGTNEKVETP